MFLRHETFSVLRIVSPLGALEFWGLPDPLKLKFPELQNSISESPLILASDPARSFILTISENFVEIVKVCAGATHLYFKISSDIVEIFVFFWGGATPPPLHLWG